MTTGMNPLSHCRQFPVLDTGRERQNFSVLIAHVGQKVIDKLQQLSLRSPCLHYAFPSAQAKVKLNFYRLGAKRLNATLKSNAAIAMFIP